MPLDIKQVRYDFRLPATPCTEEMRQAMEEIAKTEGVTLANLQRYIVSLFLAQYDSKASNFLENRYNF